MLKLVKSVKYETSVDPPSSKETSDNFHDNDGDEHEHEDSDVDQRGHRHDAHGNGEGYQNLLRLRSTEC